MNQQLNRMVETVGKQYANLLQAQAEVEAKSGKVKKPAVIEARENWKERLAGMANWMATYRDVPEAERDNDYREELAAVSGALLTCQMAVAICNQMVTDLS